MMWRVGLCLVLCNELPHDRHQFIGNLHASLSLVLECRFVLRHRFAHWHIRWGLTLHKIQLSGWKWPKPDVLFGR